MTENSEAEYLIEPWIESAKKDVHENGFENWWESKHEHECKVSVSDVRLLIEQDSKLPKPENKHVDTNVEMKYQYEPFNNMKFNILKSDIEHYINEPFDNWGETVSNIPLITFIPKSKNDIIDIIHWARKHGKRVRCSGYRHTWTDMYSQNDEVLIAMIPFEQSSVPPADAVENNLNDLLTIELVTPPTEDSTGLVKVGASVNNETFRVWAIKMRIAIPMNVIMVEITFGGSNAPICHGSGINTETLSDIVWGIELVDSQGQLRVFNRNSNPEEMKVLSGSFGLCGVIVSLTLQVNQETYARMIPTQPKLEIGVPKPELVNTPVFDKFREQILQSYYNEYFWFPPSDKLWVNCWNNDGLKSKSVEYPSHIETHMQEITSILGEFINDTIFKILPDKIQSELFSSLTMDVLPENEEIHTHIMNALHFRRGIHNMRVQNYEIEIPIPKDPFKDGPDISFVSRLWWDAVELIKKYNSEDKYPVRIALEMRIMGGSSRVLMAPQSNNDWTCSIEVLTNMNVPTVEWIEFINELNSIWTNNEQVKRLEKEGKYCRPHWAKGWQGTTINNISMMEYVKQVYSNEIEKFKQIRSQLKLDNYNMFSNPLLDKLFNIKHNPGRHKKIKFNGKKCDCCRCC